MLIIIIIISIAAAFLAIGFFEIKIPFLSRQLPKISLLNKKHSAKNTTSNLVSDNGRLDLSKTNAGDVISLNQRLEAVI